MAHDTWKPKILQKSSLCKAPWSSHSKGFLTSPQGVWHPPHLGSLAMLFPSCWRVFVINLPDPQKAVLWILHVAAGKSLRGSCGAHHHFSLFFVLWCSYFLAIHLFTPWQIKPSKMPSLGTAVPWAAWGSLFHSRSGTHKTNTFRLHPAIAVLSSYLPPLWSNVRWFTRSVFVLPCSCSFWG